MLNRLINYIQCYALLIDWIMYGSCKKCKEDVSELMNWDSLCEDYIECPKCKHKMEVCYDETWDGENEEQYWWLEDYVDD